MMLLRRIELAPLHITSLQDKVQLQAQSVALFHLPPELDAISDDNIIRSMIDGEIWVTGAPHCRLIIAIYINGKFVEADHLRALHEIVGEQLQKANVSGYGAR